MVYLILLIAQLLQPAPLYVVSPDFEDGGSIPVHCTCDGANNQPTLIVHGIPEAAKSLTLIVDGAQSSASEWLVWNIPPEETLDELTLVGGKEAEIKRTYRGLCPESGVVQSYAFKVYALDTLLELPDNAGRVELEKAMESHILASGELRGNYSRSMVTGRR